MLDRDMKRIETKMRNSSTAVENLLREKQDRARSLVLNHQQVASKAREQREAAEIQAMHNLMATATKTNRKLTKLQKRKAVDLEERAEQNRQ